MYYAGYLLGSAFGILISLLYNRYPFVFQSRMIGFWIWSILGMVGSILGSFVLVHLLFFTDNKKAIRISLVSSLGYLLLFFGVSFMFNARDSESILFLNSFTNSVLVGLCLFIGFGFLYFKISRSFGRIKLYSDGFVIGADIFDYSEIEYINYAAGPIESNIKPEYKSLPRILMSEIEYSYKGKDYEIDHFYLVVVKQNRVYICQSIMFTSGFAANARNGLKHYNYMKEKGVLYKIYR